MMVINRTVINSEEEREIKEAIRAIDNAEFLKLEIMVIGGGTYTKTIEAYSLSELMSEYYELADEIYAHRFKWFEFEAEDEESYYFSDSEVINYILDNVCYM